jgi:hypothetical protein
LHRQFEDAIRPKRSVQGILDQSVLVSCACMIEH